MEPPFLTDLLVAFISIIGQCNIYYHQNKIQIKTQKFGTLHYLVLSCIVLSAL